MTPKKDAKFCEHTPTPSPCTQQPTINKMDEKLDKVIEALSVLAVQKNEIQHISKTQDDHRSWLKGHEERLHKLELAPGSVSSRILWILASGIVTVACGIAVYAVTHMGTQ